MNMKLNFAFLVTFSLAMATGRAVSAEEAPPLVVTLQDHVFTPKEIHFAADKRVDIVVRNNDDAPEEFESPGLKVEKVVPGKSQIVVHIKPVAHGRYTFVGEYHEKTARGVAVVE